MITKTKKLYTQALTLPKSERSQLASLLVSSLKNAGDKQNRKSWEQEWATEAQRRLKRYEAGTSKGWDGNEALKSVRKSLKRAVSKSHA